MFKRLLLVAEMCFFADNHKTPQIWLAKRSQSEKPNVSDNIVLPAMSTVCLSLGWLYEGMVLYGRVSSNTYEPNWSTDHEPGIIITHIRVGPLWCSRVVAAVTNQLYVGRSNSPILCQKGVNVMYVNGFQLNIFLVLLYLLHFCFQS